MKTTIAVAITFVLTVSMFYVGDSIRAQSSETRTPSEICKSPTNGSEVLLCELKRREPKVLYKMVKKKRTIKHRKFIELEGQLGWEYIRSAKDRKGRVWYWLKKRVNQ